MGFSHNLQRVDLEFFILYKHILHHFRQKIFENSQVFETTSVTACLILIVENSRYTLLLEVNPKAILLKGLWDPVRA